jgi:hypothetical protein
MRALDLGGNSMADLPPLQLDAKGNIVAKAVTGFSTRRIAGVALLLVINYLEGPEELESPIQLGLTPAQALDLADALQSGARGLLSPTPETKIH